MIFISMIAMNHDDSKMGPSYCFVFADFYPWPQEVRVLLKLLIFWGNLKSSLLQQQDRGSVFLFFSHSFMYNMTSTTNKKWLFFSRAVFIFVVQFHEQRFVLFCDHDSWPAVLVLAAMLLCENWKALDVAEMCLVKVVFILLQDLSVAIIFNLNMACSAFYAIIFSLVFLANTSLLLYSIV
jgi:hypothetical protein